MWPYYNPYAYYNYSFYNPYGWYGGYTYPWGGYGYW